MTSPIDLPETTRAQFPLVLFGRLGARPVLSRQTDIDAARGIAIVLVVIGHIVARDNPLDNEWYATLRELIYKFHMPLFMTLAGVSFALSLPEFQGAKQIVAYSYRKVSRLIVPYLFFGLLILGGKLLASRFLHVDNVPKGSVEDLIALGLQPSSSAAGFLWFIYVLAIYFLMLPGALQLIGRRPFVLFIASLVAQLFTWPTTCLMDRAVEYLPFFAGGMLLWMCRRRWLSFSTASALVAVIMFSASLALTIPLGLPKWFVGALSIPAVLCIVQRLPAETQRRFAWIGQLSLAIYLMNTLAIGIAKGLMLKVLPWDGINFLIYFPLLGLAGLVLPILVKKLIERYVPFLNRYV